MESDGIRLLIISNRLYSIELCKQYPSLSSTILELAGAMDSAGKITKRYDNTGTNSRFESATAQARGPLAFYSMTCDCLVLEALKLI